MNSARRPLIAGASVIKVGVTTYIGNRQKNQTSLQEKKGRSSLLSYNRLIPQPPLIYIYLDFPPRQFC